MSQKEPVKELEEGEDIGLVSGKPSRRDCSWTCGISEFVEDLGGAVGYKLLVLLFFVQHVNRGFVADFTGQAETYMYKSYGVPGPKMNIFSGITQLPWALKPVIGLLSDMLPIGGYHKFPYMLMSVITGSLGLLAIGLVPHTWLSVSALVMCIFLSQTQLSVCDILTEAKYAEKIQQLPAFGPNVLSYVWFGMNTGSLLGVFSSGLLLSEYSPKLPYLLAALPAALVLVPLLSDCLEERKVKPEEAAESRKKFYQQTEAIFLSALICVVCLSLTVLGLTAHVKLNALAASVAFLAVGLGFSVFLSPTIAKFNAWSLLQTSFSLSTRGASFYFMTDNAKQFPEGPHFTPFFYNSVIGTVGSLMSLVGIVSFQRYGTKYRYRNLLLVTNITLACLNALDAMLYSRLNVRLGVPDHAFVLGTGVLQNVMNQWQWLPQVIILSYFCPKGMEATMYALLAGCHNLGNTIASSWGALLLEVLEVNPLGSAGEGAQFENLWKASLLASLLPLVTVVALFHFIPDVKQGDPVVDPSQSATRGSLWKHFWGSE